jgi:hypothetical protein
MKLATLLVVVALSAACSGDFYRFYDVVRSPTEQCEIRPNGEFCDPTQIPPPTSETWTVERTGTQTRVYIDEEVWVAEPPLKTDDAKIVRASSIEVDTQDPGPCTTTTTRDFEITVDDQTMKGAIHEKVRLTGGADCGDTPTGTRTSANVNGKIAGAP